MDQPGEPIKQGVGAPHQRWTLYGMDHDPAKRIGICPNCGVAYEEPPATSFACDDCYTLVTVPADPTPPA